MPAIDVLEEKILRRIPLEILITSGILALGVSVLFDALAALFFFSGGAFSALSFFWLKNSLSRLLLQDKKKTLKSGLILYILRLTLILAIFLFIILLFPKKLLAFGAGFSIVVLIFLGEAVFALTRMKQWKN